MIDNKKSSGNFVIQLEDGEIAIFNVEELSDNAPHLSWIENIEPDENKLIFIEETGFKFKLLEKNINIVHSDKLKINKKIAHTNTFDHTKRKYTSQDSNNLTRENRTINTKIINHILFYNPKEKYMKNSFSNEVLEFKKFTNGYNNNIFDYPFTERIFYKYLDIFNKYMVKPLIKNYEIVYCSVPSSKASNINYNSCSELLNRLSNNYINNKNFINGSNVLIRSKSVESSHNNSSDRSIEKHLNSIVVSDKNKINGKLIVLIDDIYTSGSTMNACKKLLLEAGAKNVIMFAFAKRSDF